MSVQMNQRVCVNEQYVIAIQPICMVDGASENQVNMYTAAIRFDFVSLFFYFRVQIVDTHKTYRQK